MRQAEGGGHKGRPLFFFGVGVEQVSNDESFHFSFIDIHFQSTFFFFFEFHFIVLCSV